jgi:hypothetical protein
VLVSGYLMLTRYDNCATQDRIPMSVTINGGKFAGTSSRTMCKGEYNEMVQGMGRKDLQR